MITVRLKNDELLVSKIDVTLPRAVIAFFFGIRFPRDNTSSCFLDDTYIRFPKDNGDNTLFCFLGGHVITSPGVLRYNRDNTPFCFIMAVSPLTMGFL